MANKQKILTSAQKHFQKGQYAKAAREYERAVAIDPSDLRVQLRLGEARQKANNFEGAIEVYNQVAQQHASTGFLLKAAAVYKRVLSLDAKNVNVHLRLAEVYHHLGLLSDAMSFYYAVATLLQQNQDHAGYQEVLVRMAAIEPDNVGIRIKLAEHYSQLGQLDAAVEEFSTAAAQLKRMGRLEDYAKVAERLIYHKPDALPVLKDLVRVYLGMSDTRRALAKIQMCTRIDAKDPETLELLVQTFSALGQPDKAYQVMREKARLHEQRGEPQHAMQCWQHMHEANPNDPEARAKLGLVDPTPQPPPSTPPPVPGQPPPVPQPAPAVQVAQAPVVQAAAPAPAPPPEQPDYEAQNAELERLLTETDVYIKYGLHDRAFEHLRKVFLVDPNNLEGMERIKEIHHQSGYYPQAVDELLRMTKLAYHSDRERSVGYLREAIELMPDNPETLALMESYGLTRDALFPQVPDQAIEELPGADSVDTMLAQLTADLGDEVLGLGGAPSMGGAEELALDLQVPDVDLDAMTADPGLAELTDAQDIEVMSEFDQESPVADDVDLLDVPHDDDGLIDIDEMNNIDLDDIEEDDLMLVDEIPEPSEIPSLADINIDTSASIVDGDDTEIPALRETHDDLEGLHVVGFSPEEMAALDSELDSLDDEEDERSDDLVDANQPLMEELFLDNQTSQAPNSIDELISLADDGEDEDLIAFDDDEDDEPIRLADDTPAQSHPDAAPTQQGRTRPKIALPPPKAPAVQTLGRIQTVKRRPQRMTPSAAIPALRRPTPANTPAQTPAALETSPNDAITTPPPASSRLPAPNTGNSSSRLPAVTPTAGNSSSRLPAVQSGSKSRLPIPGSSTSGSRLPAVQPGAQSRLPAPNRTQQQAAQSNPAVIATPPPPSAQAPAPQRKQAPKALSAYAAHFKQEVATAAYTPASTLGTITEADINRPESGEGSTVMLDAHDMQRRMLQDVAKSKNNDPSVAPLSSDASYAEDDLPEDLQLDLEESDFYAQQGLNEEARSTLRDLLERYPKHPAVLRRLQNIDRTASPPSLVPVDPDPVPAPAPAIMIPPPADPSGDNGGALPDVGPMSMPAFDDQPALESAGEDGLNSHFELGLAYREMGLHEDSIVEFRVSIDEGEQVREALFLMAQSYMDMGNHREAINHFKQALKSAEKESTFYAHILYRLGLAYAGLGEAVEATYYLKRIAQRRDLFPDIDQRLGRLGH